jgi:L-fucose isomerase-like protein
VVLVVTGGTERDILAAASFDGREPVLLVAHPGHNSLAAAMEVLGRLQQTGVRGAIHYLQAPDDAAGLEGLEDALHDAAVREQLLRTRIGTIGGASDWLVASSPGADEVARVWGPTLVAVDLEDTLREPDEQAPQSGDELARDFQSGAAALVEPAESDLQAAGRVHAMLRRAVDGLKLQAVTMRCFDLVVRKQTTGCLALAQLNDQGITAGCEGDVPATLAMLWVRLLTGLQPWMANPSRIDRARGVLTLAHCTVPRGIGGAYRLRSHFESGLGVGIQGQLAAGPVTLARIGGADLKALRALDGHLLRNTDHPDLCRTQVEVEVGQQALRELLEQPLGNHMVVVAGHHAGRLKRWHKAMIA